MSLLGFTLDPFGTVEGIIESWQPKGCTTEKDFEKSLTKELQKKLKKQKIVPQYGSGQQRIDLVVDDKVPIELKKDLKQADLYRTVGQLKHYRKKWDHLFLVLCGNTDPDLLRDLEEDTKGEGEFDDILEILEREKIKIIVKRQVC